MRAMIVKEFRQLRRDRRTLAMMIVMPILLLVILGYAASFDVSDIPTVVAGPGADVVATALPKSFQVAGTYTATAGQAATWARDELRDGHAAVAIVTASAGGGPLILVDGSQLFTAQAALRQFAAQRSGATATASSADPGRGAAAVANATIQVLYNPQLKTSYIMIPGLAGVILVFVGTVITSLGVVRERQAGTLEQLAVMPLRPADVFLGKIVPYFVVAVVDLVVVLAVGVAVFGMPFRGSLAVFGLGALLFVFVTLGLGVLISSVSQTQGQAIQLAVMTLLPQVLLSGLIFPLTSIVIGVRWIAYLLPLTYFTQISRGVMLRAEPISSLWPPFAYLALLGAVVTGLAIWRFRAFLAPGAAR
ncbi:MAG: ABC transporter permease [Streptosporangiaceae bacterium]